MRHETEVPLLNGELELIGGDGDYREPKGLKQWWTVFWMETVKLWGIGGPIAFNILCQFSTSSATSIFVGRIGDLQLSAVSISLSVIGCFSFGFLLGMGSALETLCGQAFGANQVHMLGVYLQRSIVISFVTCIFILPIYLFATPLLLLLGQQPEIANLSGQYTMLIIPQLFSLAIIFPTQKFLQAQSKVGILTWMGFVDLVVHVFLPWIFINVLGWGTTGAAMAYNISNWVLALAQLAYVVGWCKDGWKGLSWSALNEIWPFVRLSVASAVMLCLEFWYMMSITILTGHLNNAVTAVGSLTICMNINGWECMVFIGIDAAISIRVSNELGSGHPRATKYSVYVTVAQSFLIGILCMIVVLATREHIAIIFTDSLDLHNAVSCLAPLLGITMVLNSVQPVISGVAIGGGWQALVAYINLGSYYIFGLPLGYLVGYKANLGVMVSGVLLGTLGGMIAGTAMQTLVLLFELYKTNWKNEVKLTSERMQKWGGQRIEPDKLSTDQLSYINNEPQMNF